MGNEASDDHSEESAAAEFVELSTYGNEHPYENGGAERAANGTADGAREEPVHRAVHLLGLAEETLAAETPAEETVTAQTVTAQTVTAHTPSGEPPTVRPGTGAEVERAVAALEEAEGILAGPCASATETGERRRLYEGSLWAAEIRYAHGRAAPDLDTVIARAEALRALAVEAGAASATDDGDPQAARHALVDLTCDLALDLATRWSLSEPGTRPPATAFSPSPSRIPVPCLPRSRTPRPARR
ncbi:hypothetical protein ACWD0J_04325 [Streptomyces sp. NPDC003011]